MGYNTRKCVTLFKSRDLSGTLKDTHMKRVNDILHLHINNGIVSTMHTALIMDSINIHMFSNVLA